ncbi:MAG TPA: hypothetical protein DCS97_05450 [Planctomycetes bacterium]|nr:hypothetical protein [Planctomycetota bacterium]
MADHRRAARRPVRAAHTCGCHGGTAARIRTGRPARAARDHRTLPRRRRRARSGAARRAPPAWPAGAAQPGRGPPRTRLHPAFQR